MEEIEQALQDFIETRKASPELTDAQLLEKFPEFSSPELLQSAYDYEVTSNSGEYDYETLNSKFPEFFGEKKNQVPNESSGELPSEPIPLDFPEPQEEVGSLEFPETEETKVSPSLGSDIWEGLKAGTKEMLAGVAGTPNLINKAVFSLLAPKELEDYINTLDPDAREEFISNTLAISGGSSATMGKLGKAGGDAQESLNKDAEKLRSKMTQYDASITEDLGNLEFSKAGRRLAVEGISTIPSILQAMIPVVGLPSVAAGSAANKQEKLEDEGKNFGGATVVNSVATGIVDMVLEKYTAKQGKAFIEALKGKGKEVIAGGVKGLVNGLKEIGKGAFKEGGTEALQTAAGNLIDAITTGNEKEAFEIFTEISDSFLIGAVVGGPMKGGTQVATALQQSIKNKRSQEVAQPEGGKVELNLPVVEDIGELKKQLDYITNKEGIEPDVRAKLMKEIGDKLSVLEAVKAKEGIQPTPTVEPTVEPTAEVVVAPNTEELLEATILEQQNAQMSDAQILEGIEDPETKRTAEIIIQRLEHRYYSSRQSLKFLQEDTKKAREQEAKRNKSNLTDAEVAVGKATDLFVDRQGSVKKILKAAGLESTINHMVAKLGASSYAKHLVDEAHKKTFDRMSQKDVRILEDIIFAKNVISIDAERKRLGYSPVKHQGGMTNVRAASALQEYELILDNKKYAEMEKKAKNYFDTNRELLTTMKNEGLISQESYDTFITRDYQSRVFLDMLTDMEGNFLDQELENFEKSGLSSRPIKSMKGGSTGSQSMDSQSLQQRGILARTKAVFANRMNKSLATEITAGFAKLEVLSKKTDLTKAEENQLRNLKELKSVVKLDKIVGFTKPKDGSFGKPKYSLTDSKTIGYKPIYYYKNGVANRIFLKEDFFNKFTDTNNQILNTSTREGISKLSGTRMVKTFATGNNPLFLATNIPRDLAFALAFSQEYGSGASTIVPIQLTKLLIDFGKGVGQALSKGSSYQKYMEYGGGMDFLTIQGRYGKSGIFNKYVESRVADKFIDFGNKGAGRKAKDFMEAIKKINTASEFATRIAVFDRSIKNQLKKKGVKDISSLTKEAQDEVYTKAVRSARELTDFNQGGTYTKAFDSGIPYLNAATQGTRSAVENFNARKIETFSRVLQIGAGFTTLTMIGAFSLIGAGKDTSDEEIAKMSDTDIYFATLKGVSAFDKRNYYIFPEGKKDHKGKWLYWRVAKAQALSPVINITEGILRKFYADAHGIEYKQDIAKDLRETISTNLMPIELNPIDAVTRVPIFDAAFAWKGIDSYTGNPLDWKRGKIPEELEGLVDEDIEGFYKELGQFSGYSPARLKATTESFITTPSTNPFIGFGYLGAEMIAGGEKQDFLRDFINVSGKRFKKSTSDYNEISNALSGVDNKIVDIIGKHIKVEHEVRKVVREAKSEDNVDMIVESLEKVFEKQPEMLGVAIKWAKAELKAKTLIPIVNTLKFQNNKEARAVMIAELFGDALLKSEDNYTEKEKAIYKQLMEENVLDKETYIFYEGLFK